MQCQYSTVKHDQVSEINELIASSLAFWKNSSAYEAMDNMSDCEEAPASRVLLRNITKRLYYSSARNYCQHVAQSLCYFRLNLKIKPMNLL